MRGDGGGLGVCILGNGVVKGGNALETEWVQQYEMAWCWVALRAMFPSIWIPGLTVFQFLETP